MQQQTVFHDAQQGWAGALPTRLDSARTLVLAFAGSGQADRPEPLAELASAFPRAVVMGCSTAGEIAGGQVHDAGIHAVVARFEHTRLVRASTAIVEPGDSDAAGRRLAAQLCAGAADELRAAFVLSDGLHVNGSALAQGLAAGLPPGVAVTGGLAGDGSRFVRTWVLDRGRPCSGRIVAVGFCGQRLRLGHGHSGGWSDFGPERRITRAEGNVLYELDGRPALALYKTYLGELACGLPGTALLFPLAVRCGPGAREPLVRTVLAVDEARQSLTYAGELPQGGTARLMRANSDRLIGSAGIAARQAAQGLSGDHAALIVAVSCVGRRLVLGERTEEELEAVADAVPRGSVQVGFYSYGEIAPPAAGGASELHNQTMTVTALSEA